MDEDKGLWDANDTATELKVKPGTVYDWVYRGILPHVVLNRGPRRSCIRFRPADIRKLIEERTKGATQ